MRVNEIQEALMYVSKLINKEEVPQEIEENRDAILYSYETAKLQRGQYNHYYPLLRQSLEQQFENEIKCMFQNIVYKHVKPNGRILDVGCGNGQYINSLEGYDKIGIDNKQIPPIKDGETIRGYFPADIKPNDKYDAIIMAEFLHLFKTEEQLQMINDAMDKLNKGGVLIIVENDYSEALAYRLDKLGGGEILSEIGDSLYYTKNHWIGVLNK